MNSDVFSDVEHFEIKRKDRQIVKAKIAISISCLVITCSQAMASPSQSGRIHCNEVNIGGNDDGSDQKIGEIDIALDAKGQASSIKIARIKTDGGEAMNETFTSRNAQIKHDIEPGKINGIDEETKKPIFDWNIEKVEVIAAVRGKTSVRIVLNDHLYSGIPGSTVTFTSQGKTFDSSGNYLICEGPMRLPLGQK